MCKTTEDILAELCERQRVEIERVKAILVEAQEAQYRQRHFLDDEICSRGVEIEKLRGLLKRFAGKPYMTGPEAIPNSVLITGLEEDEWPSLCYEAEELLSEDSNAE